jgi:predicted Zn-dependent protease
VSADPIGVPADVAASFYDGRVSRAHDVRLQIGANGLVLSSAWLQREYAWTDASLSERLRGAPRLIRFRDGSHCEVADQERLDAALAVAGYRDSWVARSQHRSRYVATCTVWLVVVLFAIYRWVLPVAADIAARWLPPGVEARLGAQAAKVIEQQFPRTQLTGAQADRVWRVFDSIVPQDGRTFRLVLRDGGPFGANAFALPGGTVVVTDQLVKLADDDAALAGVLAHEIGHVENRHLLRQIASRTVLGAVVTLIGGDVSGLAVGVPAALANLSYSRDMEREADAYAVTLLKSKGMPVEPLAGLLQRLRAAHGTEEASSWASYLRTHPDTADRVAAIRAAAR